MPELLDDRLLVVPDARDVARWSDDQLLGEQARFAGLRRQVDAGSAVMAAEVARRSARELGFSGLAQKRGARTPERLVAEVTGLTVGESRAMITAGAPEPWMASAGEAVQAGEVSVGAAAAIQAGLGEPTADVGVDELAAAAVRLLDEAGSLPPERALIKAREARDELDAAGVADREAALREKRSLRVSRLADGTTRAVIIFDPENGALFADGIDRVTAPRRGGVRFVGEAEKARAQAIIDDPRTTEQLAFDAFMVLFGFAAAVDDGRVFGSRGPQVRVHVRAEDADRRVGSGWIEGQTTRVSIPTIERIVCTVGAVPIVFRPDGRALDLGRTQRLHSAAQRVVIAARDGGCIITGCDRPPSWCEVHHIDEWSKGGHTDVDTGVLLCAHHHRWLHDTNGRISLEDAGYVLHRPGRESELLTTKNPIRRAAG
jgi:hypothetical protein